MEKLWLCGITGYPPNARLAKTALEAEARVFLGISRADAYSVLKELKAKDYRVVLLEQTTESVSHDEFEPHGPVCLVVGNEIEGVAQSLVPLCDAAVEIEMVGLKNSLNVSVAFGIVAYHIRSCLSAGLKTRMILSC